MPSFILRPDNLENLENLENLSPLFSMSADERFALSDLIKRGPARYLIISILILILILISGLLDISADQNAADELTKPAGTETFDFGNTFESQLEKMLSSWSQAVYALSSWEGSITTITL